MEGFVKIDRRILDWEWYDDANTMRLFFHCLLKANWKAARWHGMTIEPGQFVTSLQVLSDETQLTISQVRTALEHLIMTGEITNKSHSKFRIITVVKWNEYQVDSRQIADKSQTNDKQIATIEERKKERIKEINNNTSFTPPTVEEVRAYCQERNNGIDAEAFVSFYESKGWLIGKNKMKDWKAAVRTWERSRQTEGKGQKKKFDDFNQRKYDFSELERLANGT